ncbi:MAG: acyl carrier protein [Planctomycetes bacterium]|nr:acyl carrier protein [Planctomycetota bacterium]
MMTESAVMSRVEALFRDLLDDDEIVLTTATTARDVEDWDSVTHLELMVAIERDFAIRFTTGEIAGFDDVGALVRGILRHTPPDRESQA